MIQVVARHPNDQPKLAISISSPSPSRTLTLVRTRIIWDLTSAASRAAMTARSRDAKGVEISL